MAAVVRDAIDQALAVADDDRRAAAMAIFAADPMPLPDWEELKRKLADERSREG